MAGVVWCKLADGHDWSVSNVALLRDDACAVTARIRSYSPLTAGQIERMTAEDFQYLLDSQVRQVTYSSQADRPLLAFAAPFASVLKKHTVMRSGERRVADERDKGVLLNRRGEPVGVMSAVFTANGHPGYSIVDRYGQPVEVVP